MEELSDSQLVERTRRGDHTAFALLLERHEASVLRVVQHALGDPIEAQDVVQEAFLHSFLDLRRLRDPQRFGAWLHGIALNLVRMVLRKRRYLSLDQLCMRGVPAELRVLLASTPPLSPEETQEVRETHALLMAAIDELPREQRELAIGLFLDGYSYAELAAITGAPLGTVKTRLHRARRRLQETLAPAAPYPLAVRRKEIRMVPMVVEGVYKRMQDDTVQNIVVLQEPSGGRVLQIWVGPFEGASIAMQLTGFTCPRPMTHDLTIDLLQTAGATISQVEINRLKDQTFYATIYLQAGGQEQTIDARPSDAIALALRANVPIAVAEQVVEAIPQEKLVQKGSSTLTPITTADLAAMGRPPSSEQTEQEDAG